MNLVLLPGAEQAAVRGAEKLCALLQANGKFIYAYDYLDGPADKQYNLLRHCGALWAILRCQRQFSRQLTAENCLRKVERGLDWLWRKYAQAIDDRALVVWHDQIKLGGNALALLTVSEFIRTLLAGNFAFDSAWQLANHVKWLWRAEKLAQGIYWLRDANTGDFIHKISVSGQVADFHSDYYTGEALFALGHWQATGRMLLAQDIVATAFASAELYPQALELLSRLAQQNYGVEFQSHWMLYAVAQEISRDPSTPHLPQYLQVLVDDINARPHYRRRKKSNPIACRSEGLLAAWPHYSPEQSRNTLDVNIMLQLQYVRPDGAIIESDKSSEVRIDTIQHNICAFARYAQLCK